VSFLASEYVLLLVVLLLLLEMLFWWWCPSAVNTASNIAHCTKGFAPKPTARARATRWPGVKTVRPAFNPIKTAARTIRSPPLDLNMKFPSYALSVKKTRISRRIYNEVVAEEFDDDEPHATQNHVKKMNHTNCGPHGTIDIRKEANIGKAYTHMMVKIVDAVAPEVNATRCMCKSSVNTVNTVAHNKPAPIQKRDNR